MAQRDCDICLGDGDIDCDACDGTGADCIECGRGRCEVCGGDGVIACPECSELAQADDAVARIDGSSTG